LKRQQMTFERPLKAFSDDIMNGIIL